MDKTPLSFGHSECNGVNTPLGLSWTLLNTAKGGDLKENLLYLSDFKTVSEVAGR